MDFKKLQQTLFDLDPTDRSEDIAKLSAMASNNSAQINESREVELPDNIPTTYTPSSDINNLMALAGISTPQAQKLDESILGRAGSAAGSVASAVSGAAGTVGSSFSAGRKSPSVVGDAVSGAFSGRSGGGRAKKQSSGQDSENQKITGGKTGVEFAKALGLEDTNEIQLFSRGFESYKKGQPPGRNESVAIAKGFGNFLKMSYSNKRQVMDQFMRRIKPVGESDSNDLDDLKNKLKENLRKKLGGK